MDEPKPCPFCKGQNVVRYSYNFSNNIHYQCSKCGCLFIFDNESKDSWNHRPAEDALNAEVERLEAVIAEIGAMTLTGMDDVEDFIFMLCKDTVCDGAIKKAYREHLKKQIANMIDFGKDTDALTKESEGKDDTDR